MAHIRWWWWFDAQIWLRINAQFTRFNIFAHFVVKHNNYYIKSFHLQNTDGFLSTKNHNLIENFVWEGAWTSWCFLPKYFTHVRISMTWMKIDHKLYTKHVNSWDGMPTTQFPRETLNSPILRHKPQLLTRNAPKRKIQQVPWSGSCANIMYLLEQEETFYRYGLWNLSPAWKMVSTLYSNKAFCCAVRLGYAVSIAHEISGDFRVLQLIRFRLR